MIWPRRACATRIFLSNGLRRRRRDWQRPRHDAPTLYLDRTAARHIRLPPTVRELTGSPMKKSQLAGEISVLERSLYAHRSLSDFLLATKQLGDLLDDRELFVRSGEPAKSYREAWIIGRFAKGLLAHSCRLIADPFPDAEVCLPDSVIKVEIAELDDPDRRRGDEYKSAVLGITSSDTRAIRRLSKNWQCWFVDKVRSKSKKYLTSAHDVDLLISNNLGFYRQLDELPQLSRMLANQINILTFRKIWHFRPDAIHEMWPDFKRHPITGWENEIRGTGAQ